MKRLLFLTIAVSFVIFPGGFLAARDVFVNYPLPDHPDTLRILAIGNSFSDDGTQYLPDLLEEAGIHNVILGRLYIGGCSLERHCQEYAGATRAYRYDKSTANRWRTVSEHAKMLDGLQDEPWDIITMQETSGCSGIYDNIRTWLPRLIGIIRREATNPRATLVWHETWAYATNSNHKSFPLYGRDQLQMLEGIRSCVRKLCTDFGISVVIPSGEAIQLARASRLNNVGSVPETRPVYDLTRDGYHLNRQFGRYIAACAWFETLIRPTLGIRVTRNPYRLRDTEFSLSPADARLCRKIAAKACRP